MNRNVFKTGRLREGFNSNTTDNTLLNIFRDFDLLVNDNKVPSVLSIYREEMKENITVLCTHTYYICKRTKIDEEHFFTSLMVLLHQLNSIN